jgi:hypoxanthine phosphoribosyltransferase
MSILSTIITVTISSFLGMTSMALLESRIRIRSKNRNRDNVNIGSTNSLLYKSPDNKIMQALRFPTPQKVHSDGVLATSSAIIGVIRLEMFARKQKPDYLIGVNGGGWLLSAYLAQRLDIERDHLLRFNSESKQILDRKELNLNNKNLLLIDDISRQGVSLHSAVEHLRSTFPSCNLFTAVMVVCSRNSSKKNIDFYPYFTESPDIELPWSSEERKKEARKILSKDKIVHLREPYPTESKFNKKSSVIKISDEDNEQGIDIANNDVEAVLKLFSQLNFSESVQDFSNKKFPSV